MANQEKKTSELNNTTGHDLKIDESMKSHPMDFYPVDMGAVRRAVFVSTIINNGEMHDEEADKGRS